MSQDHQATVAEDRIHFFDRQPVEVEDFEADGYILDIGGGGEGIIGRLKGAQVVAIDPNPRELKEAPPGPLKIVMEAQDLRFLDNTFGTATSFFTLMYIEPAVKPEVLGEVYRVLAPGGVFLIWDVVLPRCLDEDKDIVAFLLQVRLPGEEISTGYGARWPEVQQDLEAYVRLAEGVGFEIVEQREQDHLLFLMLRKPETTLDNKTR